MLDRSDMHKYQDHSVQHIIDNPGAGLFLEMGLGKTVSTLTALDILMNEMFEVSKVLVIAPKRVAEHTWSTELKNWRHLSHLTVSVVSGDEKQRKKALQAKADIYTIGRDNVVWLVGVYGTRFPFDAIVVDELSSFKSADSRRFKSLRTVRPLAKRVIGLTGTPAPNGLMDLWSQVYLLDQGDRLGNTLTGFRAEYFDQDAYRGFNNFELKKDESYKKRIYDKISDICISMKAADYLELPGRLEHIVKVEMSEANLAAYEKFEEELVLGLPDESEITVANAAALSIKLLQFANGAVYREDRTYYEVHGEKLEELETIVEAAQGKPVLVAYSYKHDLERIMRDLKKYKPVHLTHTRDIDRWNRKEIQVLVAHPASAGHGLNLQAGGSTIVWFGHTWNLELFKQFNARLDRQGQPELVNIYRLVAMGTIDERVIARLDEKETEENALMSAVRAIVKKYRGA